MSLPPAKSVLLSSIFLCLIFGLLRSLPVADAASPVKLEILSSDTDRVTGGDALVAVSAPNQRLRNRLQIRLNGRSVTSSFRDDPKNLRRKIGLVSGLKDGHNVLASRIRGERGILRLNVVNSPLQGPLFSGPQQQPFYCTTERLGLGQAQDENCFAPTRVKWFYRATDRTFKPLANPKRRPADLVKTTTRSGERVDYVVRQEQGVINRAIYSFTTLAADGRLGNGWNGRFFYLYGGGCGTGYHQGQSVSGGLDHRLLRRGFAVLGSSLNVSHTACNDVLSAETTAMVKEHAIESLRQEDVWTAGMGASGGAIQIQLIAQNYPGLLDGITPGASYPDKAAPDYPDCRLLQRYFTDSPNGQSLTGVQRQSITGMPAADGGCGPLSEGANVIRAKAGCSTSVVPAAEIFRAATNPLGLRCTLWDSMVSIYGQDPETGYGSRALDNVGVQYGLKALMAGDITPTEFLDLNETVGGFDHNGLRQQARTEGGRPGIKAAYETGRINTGAGNWSAVPVIDRRAYQDFDPAGNIHQYVYTYRLRARLDRYNGNHANHVMWRAHLGAGVNKMTDSAVDTLSRWLDRIANDSSNRSLPRKVQLNKPANAVDACWIDGVKVRGEAKVGTTNRCEVTHPPHLLPVERAGRPLSSITVKCDLKPIDSSDYEAFSNAEMNRLGEIFPDGVCDWSRPGPGESRLTKANVNRSYGPPRPATPKRPRQLDLNVRPQRSKPRSKARKVTLTATLKPCPAAIWHQVRFERKVTTDAGNRWKVVRSRLVSGRRCQAEVSLRKPKVPLKLRAQALAIRGFGATTSPARKVKPAPSKRRRK